MSEAAIGSAAAGAAAAASASGVALAAAWAAVLLSRVPGEVGGALPSARKGIIGMPGSTDSTSMAGRHAERLRITRELLHAFVGGAGTPASHQKARAVETISAGTV